MDNRGLESLKDTWHLMEPANRLLAVLPRKDRLRLIDRCEQVELVFGEVLTEAGARISHVYFPETCFISLIVPVDGSDSLEVELVGNEGIFGIPIMLGVETSPLRAIIQRAGLAWRVRAAVFRSELAASLALRRLLHRYLYVTVVQLAQTAACNRFHMLDARLARWLLITHDRALSDEFILTHEALARMLGVRRVGVTNAAGMLQAQKLISYHRGHITVLDRAGLEAVSCECYRTVSGVYEDLFG